jgi:hypothetical protein
MVIKRAARAMGLWLLELVNGGHAGKTRSDDEHIDTFPGLYDVVQPLSKTPSQIR